MYTDIIAQNPPDPRAALAAHQGFLERCQAWLATAETDDERDQARIQLISAEGEVARWQTKVEETR